MNIPHRSPRQQMHVERKHYGHTLSALLADKCGQPNQPPSTGTVYDVLNIPSNEPTMGLGMWM